MIARLYNFDNNYVDFDNKALTLEIENPDIFTKIIKDLRDDKSENIEISFECNGKFVDKKEVEILVDYDALSLTNKSITNKIFNKIDFDFSTDYAKTIRFNAIANDFKSKLMELLDDFDIEISINNELDIKGALNFIDLKPENYCDSLVDKLMQYINIISEIGLFKILCLVNLKSFLNLKNIESIIKYSLYKKLPIILIESHHNNNVIDNELKLLIDYDLCDIIL